MPGRLHHVLTDETIHPLEEVWSTITCRVLRAGTYSWGGDWRINNWMEAHHVLFVVSHGRLRLTVAGRARTLDGGDATLAPPHMLMQVEAVDDDADPARVHVVHFIASSHGIRDVPDLLGIPIHFSPRRGPTARIVAAAGRLVTEVCSDRPGAALAANGECAVILAMLWREAAEHDDRVISDRQVDINQMARFAPVFRMIRTRYSDDLSLADLAAVVGLHPVYFSARFTKTMGISPARYLARYRLSVARDLLCSTSLGLTAIAHQTGHGTASYFARVFRRVEGVSPGEYRRQFGDGSRGPGVR